MSIVDRRHSVAEGTAVKAPCRVATTANITLSGLQTIDGIAVVADDRVLVKNQNTASENGIYTASTGNWSRTRDFDGSFDVVKGTRVYVNAGTVGAGIEYVVTSADPTMGSDSITFGAITATAVAAAAAAVAAALDADASETAAEAAQAAAELAVATIGNVAHGKLLGRTSSGSGAIEEVAPAFGQCQLTVVTTNLSLLPFKGNRLTINSLIEQVPDAGVTLSASGAASSTLYYIYAYMSAGTMTLERSATVYVAQANTGVLIKTGDATRTFVGLAYTTGAGAWANTVTQRFVRSYFNDPGYSLGNNFTAARTSASGTYVEVNSEIRVEAVVWSDETFDLTIDGVVSHNTDASTITTSIGIDGTTAEDAWAKYDAAGNSYQSGVSMRLLKIGLSEGYHYATLLGKTAGSGTGTWTGSGTAGARMTLKGYLRR